MFFVLQSQVVDDSALQEILSRLPEHHRAIAQRKIASATAFGWTEIFLATFDGAKPHHLDLMGRAPVSGKPTILPEVDELAG